MKKILIYSTLAIAVMAVACKKTKDEDKCAGAKHTTTYVVERTGSPTAFFDAIKATKGLIAASVDSMPCYVDGVHLKFKGDISTYAASRVDDMHSAIQEAFSMAGGKANGGGDTLKIDNVFADTKLALEAAKYVVIAKNGIAERQ